MLRPLVNALASSIGRKLVMGATGLLLVGFLLFHLLGNLQLLPVPGLGDEDGTKFDEYVAFLQGLGGLLLAAEIGLVVLFVVHIAIALKLTMENREARKQGYVIRSDRGAKTVGSSSMHITGALVLLFVIKHLIDFRFNGDFHEDPAAIVFETLSRPVDGLIYFAGAILVGVHVSHGFRSAFQSLGASHPSWNPLLKGAGIGLAAFFALGFAGIALYAMIAH